MRLVKDFPDLVADVAFMKDAHEHRTHNGQPQKRIHGAPYWNHPYAVAEIVVYDFGYRSPAVIRKALFHDLGEDTRVTLDEIARRTDHDVANSVGRLTKAKFNGSYKERREKTIAYYRGIIDWQFDDIIVKLADRAHNLSEMRFGTWNWQVNYLGDTALLLTAIRRSINRFPELIPIIKMVEARYWQESERIIEEQP